VRGGAPRAAAPAAAAPAAAPTHRPPPAAPRARSSLDFEIIVVEDSSPDGTYEVALRLADLHGAARVRVLKRPGKLGLGSAYIDGLALATGDFVVLMDADLSHHPKFIPALIAAQAAPGGGPGGYDVVTGTRYAPGGGVSGWDLKRKLISRGANFLASLLLAPRVSDLTGSFRLYKRGVLAAIMPRVKSRGYVFQMEVAVRARQLGATIAEVPITFVDRVYGASKMGGGEIVQYATGLWTLFREV